MNDNDPIIDPLLEELLGGQQMPDLTARIAKLHAQRRQAAGENGQPSQNGHAKAPLSLSASITAASVPSSPIAELEPRSSRADAARRRSRRQRIVGTFTSLALTLVLLVVLGGAVYFASFQFVPGQGIPLAADGDHTPSAGPRGANGQPVDGGGVDGGPAAAPEVAPEPLLVRNNPPADPPLAVDAPPIESAAPVVSPPAMSPPDMTVPSVVAELPVVASPTAPRHIAPRDWGQLALTDEEVVAQIDSALAQVWKEERVQPSPAATDLEFCRRTYLQLLGRIPSVDEIQRFVSYRGRDKRAWLIDDLLSSETYAAEVASFWSARFANLLVGRAGGMTKDGPINRDALETYLATSFRENKPYDELVQELLTAEGTTSPGSENYNPATNFLVGMIDGDAKLATAKTCSIFLGQQLQCAECHTHPTTGWNQQRFWGLNAFFRQTPLAKDAASGKLAVVDADFTRKSSSEPGEVFYEQPNGLMKIAYPQFVDGAAIPQSGKLNEVDRRGELAQLIVNSDQFPQAAVNRMWQHFFGVGFTQPVDDIGPHNPASHPELLDRLAVHFAESGFDLKRLMRWITRCQAYGLSSRQTDHNLADNPDIGQPLFAHYYTRQMEAEQLFHSLQMLAKNRPVPSGLIALNADRHTWLGQVVEKMGDDEDSEATSLNGGMSQSLMMMNGGLMRQATDAQSAVLRTVTASKMSPREKVEHLFLAALSRRPAKKELAAIDEILRHRSGDLDNALQDIWWALLNSNEFILDH